MSQTPEEHAGHAPDPALFRLDGKVAVVTGASAGLGRRFAQVLHEAGATVVAVARRLERLEELAATYPNIVPVRCDLSQRDEIEGLMRTVANGQGRIDVLVNNAGIADTADALKQDDDEFASVLGVNLLAPYALSKRAAAMMIEGGVSGSIINVASIFGLRGSPVIRQTGYAASKGAVVNLTRTLAAQWAEHGIRVNALAPGWFETELTVDLFSNEGPLKWAQRRTPMGRTGGEDELDGPLLFLASRASSFMTGQTLVVDGGWCAT